MANEKRLIDANALMDAVDKSQRDNPHFDPAHRSMHKHEHNHFLVMILQAPTVDAVELPCKVGDTVWGIMKYNSKQIAKPGVVRQMFFGEDMRLGISVKGVCCGEWGKNIFATKEEVEAAIKKRNGDANG